MYGSFSITHWDMFSIELIPNEFIHFLLSFLLGVTLFREVTLLFLGTSTLFFFPDRALFGFEMLDIAATES